MKKLEHLSKIYNSYDTFIIDLWGVMHNGISLNKKAMEVVKNLTLKSKKIVFLSNAPRPSLNVKEFLMNMKMEEKYLKNIVTSGEAAMSAINQNRFGKFFFHLGPDRDEPIFKQVKKNRETGNGETLNHNLEGYTVKIKKKDWDEIININELNWYKFNQFSLISLGKCKFKR